MDTEKVTYPVGRMAALLGVPRRVHDWLGRQHARPNPRSAPRAMLTEKIIRFHAASDHVYGSPLILADLREDGEVDSATDGGEVDAGQRHHRYQSPQIQPSDPRRPARIGDCCRI